MTTHAPLAWRRSRACSNAACIEVAEDGTSFFVRDSKESAGEILTFDRRSWADFITGVKSDRV